MATKPKRPRADNPAKKRVKKSTTSKSKKPLKSTSKSKKPINDQKAATKAYKRQATALAKSGASAKTGTSNPMSASRKAYNRGKVARQSLASATQPKRPVTNTSRMVKREMGSFSKQPAGSFTKQPAGSFTKTPLEEKRYKKTPL